MTTTVVEQSETFPCFGTTCGAWVIGDSALGDARAAVATVRRRLLAWHRQFSRFEPDSELCRLNRDPRTRVPVSPAVVRFVETAVAAASLTGGLVDPTLLTEIERAGYDRHLERSHGSELPLGRGPARAVARPQPSMRWRSIEVDRDACTITRPPGVALDSGGVAKGMFADLLGVLLSDCESYAIDCGGAPVIGGARRPPRAVAVSTPPRHDVRPTLPPRASRGSPPRIPQHTCAHPRPPP